MTRVVIEAAKETKAIARSPSVKWLAKFTEQLKVHGVTLAPASEAEPTCPSPNDCICDSAGAPEGSLCGRQVEESEANRDEGKQAGDGAAVSRGRLTEDSAPVKPGIAGTSPSSSLGDAPALPGLVEAARKALNRLTHWRGRTFSDMQVAGQSLNNMLDSVEEVLRAALPPEGKQR